MTGADADLVTELVLEVFRLNGELLADGDALVADLGLTSARWQVLGAVALSPAALPVAHLARTMGLTRQSVQRIANELAAEGYLSFAQNPNHERARLVLLTNRGREVYDAALRRWQRRAEKLTTGLSAKSTAAAIELLRTIRRQLEEVANKKQGARNAVEKHS